MFKISYEGSLLLFLVYDLIIIVAFCFSEFIKWSPGQPNGGTWQNYVAIQPLERSFIDLEWDYSACVSCEVRKSTVFTLRGVCRNSDLETKYIPKKCGDSIGFLGKNTEIW